MNFFKKIKMALNAIFEIFSNKPKTYAVQKGSNIDEKGPLKEAKIEALESSPQADFDSGETIAPIRIDPPKTKPVQTIMDFAEVQISEHTKRAYRKDLENFIGYLKAQGKLEYWNHGSKEGVGPRQIAEYRDHLIKSKNLAKTTVTRKLAVLKSFYKWAIAQDLAIKNPAELVRGFPQNQDSKTGFLTDEEVDLIFTYFDKFDELGLTKESHRTVIYTLLMLALRRSEAASIDFGDFIFENKRWLLKVKGKGGRERLLPVPPKLVSIYEDWVFRLFPDAPMGTMDLAPQSWVRFFDSYKDQPMLISTKGRTKDSRISTGEIAHIVRKTAVKAGIAKKVSPHMLRATAITHSLDQGASHRGVQQMAGWTSPLMITRYDKRRNDPDHSAIHKIKYAKELDAD